MPTPLPSLTLPSPPTTQGRKRSHSSLEILSLSPPYDIKRARTGIQDLTTDDSPSLPSLVNSLSSAATADSPETQESPSDTSSSPSESTSSSGDSSEYFEVDEGYDSDSESGSTSTSSSSSSSDDSDDEPGYRSHSGSMNLSSPTPAQTSLPRPSLRSRLSSFLPTLAAANAELEQERAKGTLVNRDIEKINEDRYIEMDLGLGVLEEKKNRRSGSEDGTESDSYSSDDEANDAEDENEVTIGKGTNRKGRKKRTKRKGKGRDIMSKLMGIRNEIDTTRPGIDVVEDGEP